MHKKLECYNLKIRSIFGGKKSRMSQSEISQQELQVAGFVAKTFEILSNEEFSKIIFWGSSGKDFVIKDIDKFEEMVLPRYFRHQKINSFIRQLNMYGFHKSRKDNAKSIFSHSSFLKGREDLLSSIKRKIRLSDPPLETPTKKKTGDQPQKSIQTAVRQNQTEHLLAPQQSRTVLREFLESRDNLDSRFHLNHSLHRLSIEDFEYLENKEEDDEMSIQNNLIDKQQRVEDFGSFKKLLNPSLFLGSLAEIQEQDKKDERNKSISKLPKNKKK